MRLIRGAQIQLELSAHLIKLNHRIVATGYGSRRPDPARPAKRRRTLVSIHPDNRIRPVTLHSRRSILDGSKSRAGWGRIEMPAVSRIGSLESVRHPGRTVHAD